MSDSLNLWKGYLSNPASSFELPTTLQRSPAPAASHPFAHHGDRPPGFASFSRQSGKRQDDQLTATQQPPRAPFQLPQLRDKDYARPQLPRAVAGPSISRLPEPQTEHSDLFAQRSHDGVSKDTAHAVSMPEDDMDMSDLPLVVSDLDPRFQRQSTPEAEIGTAAMQAHNTTPARLPIMEIPISAEKIGRPPATPHGTTTMSVSIPSASPGAVRTTSKTTLPADVMGFHSGGKSIIRGRPKGWKPGMTYREAALHNLGIKSDDPHAELLLAPRRKKNTEKKNGQKQQQRLRRRAAGSHAPNYVLKRTGRPPQKTVEIMQRNIFLGAKAVFQPFVCEWAGCRAELHNLATLRKHVRVVHGREPACRWWRCAEKMPPAVFIIRQAILWNPESESESDTGGESFEEHMEYHHLAPMAWHRGDGFANSGDTGPADPGFQVMPPPPPPPPAPVALTGKSDRKAESPAPFVATKLPRYLLDERGNQVTPLVQDPQLRSAALARSRGEVMRQLNDMYRQLQRRGDF